MLLNNTLRWSDKDINKIKLPLPTTGGKSGYIITFIRICKLKWRENTSGKVNVRFVTCYFRLVGGKLARDWLFQFNKTQWQKCRAVSTDALQLLVETCMQISSIAHVPPGWTIPFGIPFPPLLQKRTKISEPFVWITSARLPAKKKMENLVAFYGWYNSIPLLFLVPKKNYHLSLTENFHLDLRISVCVLANRCFPFD